MKQSPFLITARSCKACSGDIPRDKGRSPSRLRHTCSPGTGDLIGTLKGSGSPSEYY